MTMFRWILLKMGTLSDKLCRANRTQIVYSIAVFSPPEIVLFGRKRGKNMVHSDRPQMKI